MRMVQEVTLEVVYDDDEHSAPSRWDWRALADADVAVVEAGEPRRIGKARPELSKHGRDYPQRVALTAASYGGLHIGDTGTVVRRGAAELVVRFDRDGSERVIMRDNLMPMPLQPHEESGWDGEAS
jgi:hypothetical protein